MDAAVQMARLKAMVDYAPRSQMVRYFQVAAFAIVIYDWLLMFGSEINYVWRKRVSAGSLVYAVTRYYAIGFCMYDVSLLLQQITSPASCDAYFWVVCISSALLLFTIQLTLQFRVHALYHCDRRLLITNVVLYGLSIISTALLVGYIGPHIKAFPAPKPSTGCWGEIPKYTFLLWMPGICFEAWLCALVLWRAYAQSQSDKFLGRNRNILSLLVTDSVIWFGVIFALILWVSLGILLAPRGFNIIGLSYYHAGVSVGGSRLILHMRKAYFDADKGPANPTIGVLGFALPPKFTATVQARSSLRPPSFTSSLMQDVYSIRSGRTDRRSEEGAMEMGETLTGFATNQDMKIDVNVEVEVEIQVTNALPIVPPAHIYRP